MQARNSLIDYARYSNANYGDGINQPDVLYFAADGNTADYSVCNHNHCSSNSSWKHIAKHWALSSYLAFVLLGGLGLGLGAQLTPPPTPTPTPWVLIPTPTPTPESVIPTINDEQCDEIAVEHIGFAFCDARQYPLVVTASHPLTGWEGITGFVEIWWQTLGNVLVITTPSSIDFVSPSIGIHVLNPPTNHQKIVLKNGEVWIALLNCSATCLCPILYDEWKACQYGSECSVSYNCTTEDFEITEEINRWWCKDGWTISYDHRLAWVEANKMHRVFCQGNFAQRGGEVHVTLYPSTPTTITIASIWAQTSGQVWVRAGALARLENCNTEIKQDNQGQNTTVNASVIVSNPQVVHALGSVGDFWKNAAGTTQLMIEFMATCDIVSLSVTANPTFFYRVITFEPSPIPTFGPITVPTATAIYTFDFSFVTSTCYVILEQFDAQIDLPIINRRVGFTIPHLEVCFDYYNLTLSFLGVDISYFVASIIAGTLLFAIISRLWGGE